MEPRHSLALLTENRTRQVLFYAGVSVLVLLYVVVVAGGPYPVTSRLSFAAAMISIWVVLDLILARTLRHLDAFIYYFIRVLIGWGTFLALGAIIARGNHRALAGLILFGVTAAFLGLWLAALALRQRRVKL